MGRTGRRYLTAFLTAAMLLALVPAMPAAAADGDVTTWTSVSGLPEGRFGAAAVYARGHLYTIGGAKFDVLETGGGAVRDSVNTVYRSALDADGSAPNAWTLSSALNTPRLSPGVFVTAANEIYVFGGFSGGNSSSWTTVDTIERATVNADGSLSAWQVLTTKLTSPRGDMGVYVPEPSNGRLYLIGGDASFSPHSPVATVESVALSDLAIDAGTWRAETSLPEVRRGHGTTGVGSRVLVAGGSNSAGQVTNTIYRGTLNADGALQWDTLSTVLPATQGISEHSQLTQNGFLYISGGIGNSTNSGGHLKFIAVNADATLSGAWQSSTSPTFGTQSTMAEVAHENVLYLIGHDFARRNVLYARVSAATPKTNLGVTATDSADPVVVGDVFSLTSTVTNHSLVTATNVSLSVTLPSGLRIIGGSPSTMTCSFPTGGQSVLCTRQSLEGGASTEITVQVRADVAGTHESVATVTAAESDSQPSNNTARQTTTVTAPAPAMTLYGVESGSDSLSRIDPVTGAMTVIGRLDPDINKVTTPIAMAVRPSDGKVFVWNNSDGAATGNLLTVDTCTGRGTRVNASTAPQGQLSSLAFSPTGVLYGLDTELYTINTATGVKTLVGPLGGVRAGGADFDPVTGTLYAVDLMGNSFVTVNTATGAATTVGTLSPNQGVLGSIAFKPGDTSATRLLAVSLSNTIFDINVGTGAVVNVRNGGGGAQGLGFAPPCTPLPDLVVTSFTAPSTVQPGGTASYTWTIRNQGTATASIITGPSVFGWADQVWLSTSATSISNPGVPYGAGGVVAPRSLAPGESYTQSFSATIQSTVPRGSYYFILQTDSNSQIGESDESNNLSVAVPVTVGRPEISGFAQCGDTQLPGATVQLLSGSVLLATTTANADAFYSFNNVAAGATYTIRITGSITVLTDIGTATRSLTCGLEVITGGTDTVAPAGTTIPNRLNHTWTTAYDVRSGGAAGSYTVSLTDYVFTEGQSTWFKFPVREGQHVTVNVTDVPADYSVTLYKDIRKLYLEQQSLINADPLANVDIIDGSVAPDALSPDALSPDALSPDALSPDALSPDALSPDALSPDALSPDALSPDALSPDALSPDALSPDALSPDALSPDALSPDVYASAQVAALIGVSAHVGLSPERIARNTWSNSGYFYVRVRGHNGAFEPAAPFTLTVRTVDSACAGVALPTFPAIATNGFAGMKTVILTNSARLASDAAFAAKLASLAGHARVQGVVVDLAGVADSAYAQWDTAKLCPAAANVIAQGIRGLVGAYRTQYPTIEHVVLVGGDDVIPFFRTPDQSGLGNERDYAPPVADDTASQASLKLGYVLTQDPYGAGTPFSRYDHELYIAELGVGRLVETPAQITPVIDAFLTSGGVIAPQRALVTGYDFLSDAALAIGADLVAGGVTATDQDLIQPVGHGPTASTAWTADQLRAKLLTGPRADIVALNGHFSANRALAADYATRLGSEEIQAVTDGRFVNTLVLSTGCHSGYNIVDGHAVALTQPFDFPQAFAFQGATLVGGTGYQYGDTDFIKYSELIHHLLVREMRYGSGPVNVGTALANAKRAYVSQLPALRGIDEKALAEATLYGLPMTAVDLPARIARPGAPLGGGTTALTSTLAAATWQPAYTLHRNEVTLTSLGSTTTSTAVYYDIAGNVAVSPGTPVLPLLTQNVERSGTAARGVVLLGANYQDESGVLPFTNVAVTEVRAAHPQYTAEVFTPVRPFALNHFAGTTLVTTPFQFRSDVSGTRGTARTLTQPTYKIYYSSSTAANVILASSPVVYAVHLTPVTGGVRVDVIAGAASSVAIQEIFATYTGESGALYGSWTSLALVEDTATRLTSSSGVISTYRGTITTADPAAVRVFVQAVAGNGLVTAATNNGAYYRVVTQTATAAAPKAPTQLALSAPASAPYLGTANVSATLTSAGAALAGRRVYFRSGDTRIEALTGANGAAAVALPINAAPGTATVSVGFAEDVELLPSGAEATLTVTRAASQFVPAAPVSTVALGRSVILGELKTGARVLNEQPITITGAGRTLADFTDGYGRVRFDATGLPIGVYPVTVGYAGNDRFSPAESLAVLVVVYDPDSSVTGGGWVLTGGVRSNFAFTVKYAKDGGAPNGSLEFHARDRGLVVRATKIDWLLASVSAGTASFEGAVTVNGATGYRARVNVLDARPDTFEIVVSDAVGEYYRASAAIGGGSITVR